MKLDNALVHLFPLVNFYKGRDYFSAFVFYSANLKDIAESEAPSPRERARGEASFESVIRAAEMCQSYFWAQSSWAVVYCVCRDHLEMDMTMNDFERRVAEYSLSPKTKPCPEGTVRSTLKNNDYMHSPISRWPEGRAKILAEALVKALG